MFCYTPLYLKCDGKQYSRGSPDGSGGHAGGHSQRPSSSPWWRRRFIYLRPGGEALLLTLKIHQGARWEITGGSGASQCRLLEATEDIARTVLHVAE